MRIAITGAAGQLGYQVIFRLIAGEGLGSQRLCLRLIDLPQMQPLLEGMAMEIQDSCSPWVERVEVTSSYETGFADIDCAILIGAKPRGAGEERAQLLASNGAIFVAQGKALDRVAAPHAKILVVGNPCNTNALVAMHHAPRLARQNFHALMRLDQNRAVGLLAQRSVVTPDRVQGVTVWGNHSSTQVPDITRATIEGRRVEEVITDSTWLQSTFVTMVRSRGASIISKLGRSSVGSAAQAVMNALHDLYAPTPEAQWFSTACARANSLGIPEDLIFGYPCRTLTTGECVLHVAEPYSDDLMTQLEVTKQELLTERDLCAQHELLE